MERYLVDILPDEGLHGRRVITTNEQKITADNVLKVLNTSLSTHDRNREEIQYLWDVYRGKQDIRKKEKIVREEIKNRRTITRIALDAACYVAKPATLQRVSPA